MIKSVRVIKKKSGMHVFQAFTEDTKQEIELTDGFKLHKVNEILRDLAQKYDIDYEIYFRSFKQYKELVSFINSAITA